MAFGKRQLVLAALVVALGTAVYLNWQFSSDKDLNVTNTVNKSKELGEAHFVDNKVAGESAEENDEAEHETAAETDYFARARESRKQARDEATESIKEVLGDAGANEEAKAEAVKQAAAVAKNIQVETNIESLVKAKGIADCVVFIHGDECSVVVSAGSLNETVAVSIKDIIAGQGGLSAQKLKIAEAK